MGNLEGLAKVFADNGGITSLIILALFVLVAIDRVLVERSNSKITDTLIRTLYERGHLPDRRQEDRPVEEDKRGGG